MIALNFGTVAGLTGPEQKALDELVRVYSLHQAGNAEKEKYYEGHVALKDVNLGIALPQGIRNLEVGCSWGQKAVDVLAARSMFDGFVSSGGDNAVLNRLIADNRLIAEYGKACRDELKYGCAFATLSADAAIGCKIRFHSPATAAALWSGEKGRIACGLAIIDTVPDEHLTGVWQPRVVNLYMDNAVTVLRRRPDGWNVQRLPHRMGRPLMEPLIWNATSGKPFGRSRLKRSIRTLIDDYIRTVANATIALEFDTTPQKYILGVTDEQYDVLISDKFKSYVGSLLAATSNPETGENPVFGQLAQGSLSPHTEKMRMTATQFAAATGLTVTDVGVVNDANPTSSDAILAQSQTLVLLAQQLNTGNGDALRTIAQMAQAILRNVPPGALTEEERNVMPHFKNPAMPSVAVTADAAIKIATAREEFASTDTFLEMVSDWYNEKYKELTGTAPVLGDAAPEKLLQYAIAMLGGQTLQYIQDKGNGELLATSYGNYLDQLAANLGVTRKPADRATVTMRFTLADTRNNAVGIPAGTRVRTENSLYFNTLDYAEVKAGELTADVLAQAQEAGAESNGIEAGAINTLVDPIPYMESVTNIEASHGGTDTEDDDALSERVFLAPSVFSCAGPADAYVAEIRLPAYETENVEVEDEDAKDGTEEAAEDTTPADEQAAAEEAGVTEDEQQGQDAEPATMAAKQTRTVTRRLPLDMSKVELDLFAIDGIYINQLDGEF